MYEKQTWIDGVSIANAERLNHIERGIESNSKDIEKLKDVNIMQISPQVSQTISGTNLNTINCMLHISVGDKLQFENNGVKIGTGISKVKVSANIFLDQKSGGSEAYMYGHISKNAEDVAHTITYSNSIFGSTPIPQKIIPVKEGDIITLGMELSKGTAITRAGANSTWLYVEVVE